jgi:type III pantothenate kinase
MVWLSLIIGNSRLHWAWWQQGQLQGTWHSPQGGPEAGMGDFPTALAVHLKDRSWQELPLYWASVVPDLTALWQQQGTEIALDQVPLDDLYPTLGIDRALAAYGAGEKYGYPVLAIDGGTAITLTGIDQQRRLVGGAIWPGLALQRRSLAAGTGQLPAASWPAELPSRWSRETLGAMHSGILYATGAGLRDFGADWQRQFPQSRILVTGGDGELLTKLLQAEGFPSGNAPRTGLAVAADPNLAWWGLGLVVSNLREI